jgi:two-component system sensor histidine kinase BaeS
MDLVIGSAEKEMFRSLWIKFFVLILAVSIISLSTAYFIRELMVRDFREYLEGEMLDRVHWITADLEGTHEKYSGWREDIIAEDAIWALMLGLEIRIKDMNGKVVMDTDNAINTLSPLIRRRVLGISNFGKSHQSDPFMPYPLFLGGKEIGQIEVRFLPSEKENIFISRSNKFLVFSLFILGGISVLLSIVVSRRLTAPIKRLSIVAKAIGEGDLKSRVRTSNKDEIGYLSLTFNKMAQNLETQEGIRKRVISNIAHELRTPIAAIRGELEGMMDGLMSTDKEQLQSLYEETGRLKRIIEGIEELTQAEVSSLSLKKKKIDLGPFLGNIIDRFSSLFTEKGIAIKLECDKTPTVYADPDRLSQIIINLLSNALKAAEKGGDVKIKAHMSSSETVIEVWDNGCGIREEDLPFIFERFYKAAKDGIGLGLAIVRELVQAHSGKIEVKSEHGKGSIFTVFIPHLHNFS